MSVGQQQREDERREDRRVRTLPPQTPTPALVINSAVPWVWSKTKQNHHRCLCGVVIGDGHYNERNCGEQK